MRTCLLALVAALRPSAAAPLAPADTWSSFSTILMQPVRAGERELVVQDCRRIQVGGRVRISFASEEEEEGAVAALECAGAHAAATGTDDCDLSSVVGDGVGTKKAIEALPERCRSVARAALRVPGMAASYRDASRVGTLGVANLAAATQQQQPAANALLPTDLSEGVRGAATLLQSAHDGVEAARARVPGVVTLSAGLLFDHAANVSLRGTAALTEGETVSPCPEVNGLSCSGRGHCEGGSCLCEEGYKGDACEGEACEGGCGEHGSCVGYDGQCVCHVGWTGHDCRTRKCESDCSGRGNCVGGACACHTGFHGKTCSVHTTAACPGGCNGHGNCAVVGDAAPVCLCHSKYVGESCLQQLNECPGGCSDHGTCDISPLTNQPECTCYPGYSGPDCSQYCPHNCTAVPTATGESVTQGRCTSTLVPGSISELQCICKQGFSGPDCSQRCPSRCNGHGDCVNGLCVCLAGYDGPECERPAPVYLGYVFLYGIQGFHPVTLPVIIFLFALLCFCCTGYTFNRWRGRFGTSAIPLWDYYAKRWRNAPLFEPIFAVPAATQTAPPK